jgi:phenylalanyl-tRNA synthetase alpha chain
LHLNILKRLADESGPLEIRALADALNADQSPVSAACVQLAEAGHVVASEESFDEYRLGPDATPYLTQPLPERVIVEALRKLGGECPIGEMPQHSGLDAGVIGQSLRFMAQRGWASNQKGKLVLESGSESADAPQPDELLIKSLANDRVATASELSDEGVPVNDAVNLLAKRRNFLVVKQRTARRVAITDSGRALLESGVKTRKAVTQLTPDMLADGSWRDVDIKPYDVTLAAKKRFPGKEHAFQRTLNKVRRCFLEMGFEEIVSPWVESSFWDFDALFQPQDHPARDMQDTFYVAEPGRCDLPDDELVEHIRATHENGGDTGSTGWQYRWSRELAHKPVLRTHTTAATIRALARHTQGRPGRYFVVGPVFRRETVDFKHLPIFHQIDGIIVDPKASLATLKGTLTAFYQKMGFAKVEFAPSFFPYTEPSAEVFAYLESKGQFVEMGGSGIFRPEVTRPLGIQDRVLAWGCGLERIAMMVHNLDAIGDIYFASMPWLREEPLCQS